MDVEVGVALAGALLGVVQALLDAQLVLDLDDSLHIHQNEVQLLCDTMDEESGLVSQ